MDIFAKNTQRILKGHGKALYAWCVQNSQFFCSFSLSEQKQDERLKKFNFFYLENELYLIRFIPFNKGELGFVKFLAITAKKPLDAVYKLINDEKQSLICIEKTQARYCKDLNNFMKLQNKRKKK